MRERSSVVLLKRLNEVGNRMIISISYPLFSTKICTNLRNTLSSLQIYSSSYSTSDQSGLASRYSTSSVHKISEPCSSESPQSDTVTVALFLTSRLLVSTNSQKQYIPLVAYAMNDGPWRDTLIKLGYDPRQRIQDRL